MKTTCPKCASENARYTFDGVDVTLRCTCGYHRVVVSKLEQITIHHSDSKSEVRLPKRDSNLWWTLVALVALGEAKAEAIAERLVWLGKEFNTRDVSSYLTILRTKNLVKETEIMRRTPGGSTWKVEERCMNLIGAN
jgi:hypothetical protein